MIVDSSALVAIVFQENDYELIIDKLVGSNSSGIGTPTLVEAGIVVDARLRKESQSLLSRMLDEFEITQVPFGEPHWRAALVAYRRFGRGRHRANLNFGDCLAYAVAQIAGEPLLFVGENFAATDLSCA
jgi:ribonuclease VapC